MAEPQDWTVRVAIEEEREVVIRASSYREAHEQAVARCGHDPGVVDVTVLTVEPEKHDAV